MRILVKPTESCLCEGEFSVIRKTPDPILHRRKIVINKFYLTETEALSLSRQLQGCVMKLKWQQKKLKWQQKKNKKKKALPK